MGLESQRPLPNPVNRGVKSCNRLKQMLNVTQQILIDIFTSASFGRLYLPANWELPVAKPTLAPLVVLKTVQLCIVLVWPAVYSTGAYMNTNMCITNNPSMLRHHLLCCEDYLIWGVYWEMKMYQHTSLQTCQTGKCVCFGEACVYLHL